MAHDLPFLRAHRKKDRPYCEDHRSSNIDLRSPPTPRLPVDTPNTRLDHGVGSLAIATRRKCTRPPPRAAVRPVAGSDILVEMGRNYSLATIKVLFAEASRCAYPGCDKPLIFRDRGVTTVVAQIAHIRSERPGGPRYDPLYPSLLIDEAENLLLLCGMHHPPVDRHESIYSVEELEAWKAAQQANAGGGTVLTEHDARFYARLTTDERTAIAQIARLAERLIVIAEEIQHDIDQVTDGRDDQLQRLRRQIGPVYEVDSEGTRKAIDDRIELPYADEVHWAERLQSQLQTGWPRLIEARRLLLEELAVLAMYSGLGLASEASVVALTADAVIEAVNEIESVEPRTLQFRESVAQLWAAANGES